MGNELRHELLCEGIVGVSTEDADNLFAYNRQRLMEKLHGEVVVVAAYASLQRSNDIAFSFEQEANFWWLSGIEMPNWWLIIDGTRGKSWLVAPAVINRSTQDRERENESIHLLSGVEGVLAQDAGMQMLRELAKKHSVVRTLGEPPRGDYLNFSPNPAPKKMYDVLDRIFNAVQDCRRELAQLRAIKHPEEIARIKKAINLTMAAFEYVKPKLVEMRHEYEIEAELTYQSRMHGAARPMYDPVVAAGSSASDVRYRLNDGKLKKRELVLIDTGARMQGYIAGVTRTYAYGEPTRRQQAVYETLRQAQMRIIALLEPHLAVDQYQRDVDSIMRDALASLGLMSTENSIDSYRRYFPHAISHGVGVDLHDSLGAPHFFQPGMVLTVGPGIYIPEEKIGVRLEDNILITPTSTTNLSARLSTDL